MFNFNDFSLLEKYGVPEFAKKLSGSILSDLFKNDFTSYVLSIDEEEIEDIKMVNIVILHIVGDFSSKFKCDMNNPLDTFSLEFDIPIRIKNDYNYFYEIILHELTHLYEFYKIYKRGIELPIYNKIKKGLVNTIQQDNIDPFNYFRNMVYLTLDNELNARVSQTYNYLIQTGLTDDLLYSALKKSSSWKKMELILKFNPSVYVDDLISIIGVEFGCLLVNIFNTELMNNDINHNFKMVNNRNDLLNYFKIWNKKFKYKMKKHKLKLIKLAEKSFQID